ncbi:flavin reductase domain-containing FMN-binding protein [Methylorubrum populi]|uniref:FMN reductase (NADH) RutF n=1 Tax=Methylorubrum populi TaxID=223967 RepID=A0A160PGV2_9HYPH|nr:flavin reductase [Methylorubrum populi]BAU91925.1 flavin reductase domain-containing FMN-binding protein [Methylorubrum populi]
MTSPDPEAVSASAYREAMAQLASAVHLITTDGPGGRAGLTATSVCSVSDGPPTLLVCLNRGSSAYPAFLRNGVLCINTLTAAHESLAADFAGRVPRAERFNGRDWGTLQTGAPVLPDALVAFDCRIVDRHAVGTHDVLICAVEVLAEIRDNDGLLYAGRHYRVLPHRAAPAD